MKIIYSSVLESIDEHTYLISECTKIVSTNPTNENEVPMIDKYSRTSSAVSESFGLLPSILSSNAKFVRWSQAHVTTFSSPLSSL